MNDLNLYYIFYIVAKKGNITKASEELFISQPAVTQAVQALERNIGATLFIRTKKGVTLTEEAKVLFQFIETGLTYIQNGENKFKELKNINFGSLKIGASATITEHVLLKKLDEYHEQYPNISISITNHLTQELIKLLRDGSVDLLVLNLPMKEKKDLEILPFLEVHDAFMVGKKKRELLEETNIMNLKDEDFIFQKLPSNTRQYLDDWLKKEKISLEPKYDIVSFHLVKEMTKMGFGIGYITKEFAKDELEHKELWEIPIKEKIPSRHIGIVTLKNTIPSFAARAFIDILTK